MVHHPYFPQNAVKIHDATVAEGLDNIGRHDMMQQDTAEKAIAIATRPPKDHPSAYDRGPHLRENIWSKHLDWKNACSEDHTTEYVRTKSTEYMIIPAKGREKRCTNIAGIKMADVEGEFDFRDTGKLVTEAHDLERDVVGYTESAVGSKLKRNHSEALEDAPDIGYIVINTDPDMIYAVAKICEHSAILYANQNSREIMQTWAEREGIDVKEMTRRGIGEEVLHLLQDGKASVAKEVQVRNQLIEAYSELADNATNPETKETYSRLVKSLKQDLTTVRERYSKAYSNRLTKSKDTSISELEQTLAAEAVSEHGINSLQGITEYVSKRISELKESGKEGKNTSGNKKSRYTGKTTRYLITSKGQENPEASEDGKGESTDSDSDGESGDGEGSEGSGEGGE